MATRANTPRAYPPQRPPARHAPARRHREWLRWATFIAVAALTLFVAATLTGGRDTFTSGNPAAARCETVPLAVVDRIAAGLTVQGATLGNARAVRSGDFDRVWLVAAQVDTPGATSTPQIGLWATNSLQAGAPGSILAIDSVARSVSRFGSGGSGSGGISSASDGATDVRSCVTGD